MYPSKKLPILESGLLDIERVSRPRVFIIKDEEFIAAILDSAPVLIKSNTDVKRLFAVSGIPARPSDLMILVPNDYYHIASNY